MGPVAFLHRLNPAVGSYTGILPASDSNPPFIGHLQYVAGDRSARIVFLMPDEDLGNPNIVYLLDHLAIQAGAWGAFHLLAEVEESSCALEGLRRSGFSVYAWQRIWKFAPTNGNHSLEVAKNGSSLWQPSSSMDEIPIRSLFQSLVPPLVQSAEPLTSRRLAGWVYRQEGEIMAYVEGIYGPHGIYLQPLIHPAMENVSTVLANLLMRQPTVLGRPIYMAIRSYQAWLETVVRNLECEVAPRHALMVKHLVLQQRDAVPVLRHSVLEKYKAEPTVPLVNNSTVTHD